MRTAFRRNRGRATLENSDANQRDAKAWGLRAATSLARLLRDTNRREAARSMLAEIYGWFAEAFDTVDL